MARNFVLYHSVKEIKIFEQQRNFLSEMYQNLIRTSLYQDATKYKVLSCTLVFEIQCPQNFGDRHFIKRSNHVQDISNM